MTTKKFNDDEWNLYHEIERYVLKQDAELEWEIWGDGLMDDYNIQGEMTDEDFSKMVDEFIEIYTLDNSASDTWHYVFIEYCKSKKDAENPVLNERLKKIVGEKARIEEKARRELQELKNKAKEKENNILSLRKRVGEMLTVYNACVDAKLFPLGSNVSYLGTLNGNGIFQGNGNYYTTHAECIGTGSSRSNAWVSGNDFNVYICDHKKGTKEFFWEELDLLESLEDLFLAKEKALYKAVDSYQVGE